MKEELSTLIKAQYPLIYLVTSEEERAQEAIASILTENDRQPSSSIFLWTVTRGIYELADSAKQSV